MKKKKLGEIATIYNGNSINKGEKEVKYMKDVPGWNYIGTKDVDFDGTITYRNGVVIPYSEKQFRLAPAGSVFVCSEGGSAGRKTAIVKEDVCFGNKLFAIVNDKGLFNEKYLYYYTRYNEFREQFRLLATSLMGGISLKNFNSIELPLPELTEQDRIVERIEELFSEIDSGIDTLLKTKEQLYAYRQAVLKDAFSIYNKNGTIDICSITEDIRIGPFGTMLHKSDYVVGGVPVINPQHIKNNAIKPSKNVTVNEAKANELSAYRLKANDIIMGRRGEMGRTAPVSINEAGWICGTGSILFRLKPEYDAEFYSQILSSPDVVHYLEENATGTTMKNLNEGIVAHIPVPIVTRKMQDRIKLVMDEKLSLCEDIEKTVEKTLEQAEAMRQSVLKKAFEGEL